jgi:hypothetical protein
MAHKPNWQNFNANYFGNWLYYPTAPEQPEVTWYWDPSGDGNTFGSLGSAADTWHFMTKKMEYGIPYKDISGNWHGSSSVNNVFSVVYTTTDNGDGATATAKYILTLHDEWEHLIDDNPAQTTRTDHRNLNVPRIVGPQTAKPWTFFDATIGQKATATANFGVSFKLSDWLNLGGSFTAESSLDISGTYNAASPPITLAAGESAIPRVSYIVKTVHKLVDHFTSPGWDRNTARPDGKWQQSADLDVNIQDVYADWDKIDANLPAP